MDLNIYQEEARATDRVPATSANTDSHSFIVPLLGLAGEAGGLLSEYKKFLRDGPAHQMFKERVREELGDILWYLANVATKFDLDLNSVAAENLRKIKDRWDFPTGDSPVLFGRGYSFDAGFPAAERFPRQMEVELKLAMKADKEVIQLLVDGVQCGDDLTDNAYTPDGYGFHDVIHFANIAVLGWSPVLRKLLGCKRKSDPKKDEVEDGGRAGAIEEGLAAVVFAYARHHQFFDGVSMVDYELLKSLRTAAQHLEVRVCSLADWQNAITQGYAVWRPIAHARGGKFKVDLDARTVTLMS